MALKDNDYYETGTSLRTMNGGNGDYYVEIWSKNDKGLNENKCVRIAMSGGLINDNTRLKRAFAELHFAMEEAKLNDYPK